jgi:hypothetical protein
MDASREERTSQRSKRETETAVGNGQPQTKYKSRGRKEGREEEREEKKTSHHSDTDTH